MAEIALQGDHQRGNEMTRKHFNRIAEILAQNRPAKGTKEWWLWIQMVDDIAQYCYEQNFRFNKNFFIEACTTWEERRAVNE